MSHSRNFLLLILLLPFLLSCSVSKSQSLRGLWVSVPTEELDGIGLIRFFGDSIYVFKPNNPWKLRASFSLHDDSIQLVNPKQFYWGDNLDLSNKAAKIQINGDTLKWGSHYTFIKSKYDSYVQHYANSKGLSIDLPTSQNATSNYQLSLSLDIFIGYRQDKTIGMKVQNQSIEFGELVQALKRIQSEYHEIERQQIPIRLFMDKALGMEYIDSVYQAIEQIGIRHLILVTNNPTNQFSEYFSGTVYYRPPIDFNIVDDEK